MEQVIPVIWHPGRFNWIIKAQYVRLSKLVDYWQMNWYDYSSFPGAGVYELIGGGV